MDGDTARQDSSRESAKIAFLERYRKSLRRLDYLGMELQEARQRADSLKSVIYDRMPRGSGGHNNDLSDIIIRLEEHAARYRKAFRKCEDIRQEIIEALEALENQNEYDALYLLYITGISADSAAEKMNLSTKSVYRLRQSAMQHLKI